MIGRMFVLAIGMILGFSAVLIGGVVIAVGRDVAMGVVVAAIGVPVAVGCLVGLVRLNRRYQADALVAVLADPSQVVARWGSDEGEVILARRGLFIGPSYHPFAAAYQVLTSAALVEGRLVLEFANIGADGSQTRSVAVPEPALAVVRGFVARRARE